MTRRLDGPELGPVNLDSSDREARRVAEPRGQPISRRLLEAKKVPERAREAKGATFSDFPPVGGSSGLPDARSLDDALLDFVMPHIPEPAVLRRKVPILQRCINDVVPLLEGGEQLRNLAKTLMQDEIERHRDLLGRLQEGTET